MLLRRLLMLAVGHKSRAPIFMKMVSSKTHQITAKLHTFDASFIDAAVAPCLVTAFVMAGATLNGVLPTLSRRAFAFVSLAVEGFGILTMFK